MIHQRIKLFLSIVLIIALIVIFHALGWLRPLEFSLRSMLFPGVAFLYEQTTELEDGERFTSFEELKNAYRLLKETSLKQDIDQARLHELEQQNEQLRVQLHFVTSTPYTTLGVDVIGKNIDPVGSALIINRGRRDGVQLGDPAVAYEGILVGKVSEVYETYAILELLTDNQSKVAATILNMEKSIGLVEGGYGLSIRMNLIPQNEGVHVGDTVITSGLEPSVPRGLVIGTVETVEKEAFQPFQRALITSPIALDRVSTISLLIQ